MSSHTRQQLEEFVGKLDVVCDAVVDIGGSQLPVSKRVRKIDAKRYDILDLQDPHKGEAPDIIWDLNEMGDGELPFKTYDMAFCLEVMEYIWNPVVAIENIAYLLKDHGVLYISFPFIYPQHEPLADDALRYTRAGAVKLLEEGGFRVDEITHRTTKSKGILSSFYSMEGMRPAQAAAHEDVGYIIRAIKKPSL